MPIFDKANHCAREFFCERVFLAMTFCNQSLSSAQGYFYVIFRFVIFPLLLLAHESWPQRVDFVAALPIATLSKLFSLTSFWANIAECFTVGLLCF
jgi:hypothetical protein